MAEKTTQKREYYRVLYTAQNRIKETDVFGTQDELLKKLVDLNARSCVITSVKLIY